MAEMAIDYVLAVGCPPHRQLGIERLVTLDRTRIIARSALARLRADGDDRDPGEITLQMATQSPSGTSESRGVTVADLLAEAAPLDAVAEFCEQCPAGLPRAFACHRRIRYPIPEHVEQWLMARLPTSLACTAGVMLARALGDFGWDGAPCARMRAAGDTFFESRVPYGVRWQPDTTSPGVAPIELSSDQLMQMLFFVGHVTPSHALMMALFLGVVPHDTPLADLVDAAGRERALARAYVPAEPDADIEQLAAYLRALLAAVRLDVTIEIDA